MLMFTSGFQTALRLAQEMPEGEKKNSKHCRFSGTLSSGLHPQSVRDYLLFKVVKWVYHTFCLHFWLHSVGDTEWSVFTPSHPEMKLP